MLRDAVWQKQLQLWATGDWQLHHDNMPPCASRLMHSFLAKHQITRMTHSPSSPDLAPCKFWLFPKPKSALEGKRFQTFDEIQENTMGQRTAIGRTVWGPKVPTLKGTEVSLSYVQCFLYLFQQMSLFFTLYGWIPSGQTWYFINQNCF